jgi:hypothetical protein
MSSHLLERNLPSWNIQDATKLQAFCACPRKYFWEYVLGWRPEAPSNHLVFGQAWHKAMEYLLEHDYSIDSVQKAHEEFLHEYRKIFSPETDEIFFPKTPENALIALARYAGRFKDDLQRFKVLYTEISGSITVGESREVYFRMDTILKDLEDYILSIDHKTGSYTYGWENQFPLSHQTGIYTHVLYCLNNKEKVKGLIYRGTIFGKTKKAWDQLQHGQSLTYKDPVEFVEYPAFRSKEQMQMWLWNINAWLDLIQFNFEALADCSEDEEVMFSFPQQPTACSNYGGCIFADFCSAWPNPLRRCQEPPLNFKEDHWDPTKLEAKHVFKLG